jgi:AcrR family transcriptional regulator
VPKGRAPHRRDENARLAVLHAADDLLVERGFGGVTIEGIAARAGVAKQTIYRWWPSKVDMRALARFLTKDPAGKVLLALIGEAQHDREVARVFHERYLGPQRRSEREMLRRGVTSGEFAADLDIDATLDALCGPIF